MSNYAQLKTLPGFCYTCVNIHDEERHKRNRERKNRIQQERTAKERAQGIYCATCVGPHHPRRHEDYKRRNKLYARSIRGTKCAGCKGRPHNKEFHEQVRQRILEHKRTNRNKINEYQRNWFRAHPEKRREYDRKYYQTLKQYNPHLWEKIYRGKYIPKEQIPPPPEYYPYNTDHPLVNMANEMVPKTLPDDVRADACQELILSMLEGRKPELGEAIKKAWKMRQSLWQVSLDAPDEEGRTLLDRISEDDSLYRN